MTSANIRNFAIIAHIDHGKSTLADRLLELTGTVEKREMQEQVLDSNPIERERGITIKLAPVRMEYSSLSYHVSRITSSRSDMRHVIRDTLEEKDRYILNLIDTPGHVDFSYEVSRSLAACEGALLVVDATQGVQAQTLAHLHQARQHNLAIIPIINKIDLPNARIAETQAELEALGFRKEEVIKISAKTGEKVEEVLAAIVERIPPPRGEPVEPLRALVFSSQYDPHKGVVVFVRVVDGDIMVGLAASDIHAEVGIPWSRDGQGPDLPGVHRSSTAKAVTVAAKGMPPRARRAAPQLRFLASGAEVTPIEIGYFSPKMMPSDILRTGEVGYIATGLKDVRLARVGDTVTEVTRDTKYVTREDRNLSHVTYHVSPLRGYKEPKPMVFLGLFPVSADSYQAAREAVERLRLSDSAFTFRPVSSLALGNGFHCGFLGLLHAEIVQERLLREFGLTMMATTPSVEYQLKLKSLQGARTISSPPPKGPAAPKANGRIGGHEKLDERPQQALVVSIQSAAEFPDPSAIEKIREPVMKVTIYSPKQYVGAIMQLVQEKRGEYIDLKYQADQAEFTYLIPLAEMIVDFFDRLKSVSEGYASLDYEFFDYQAVELVKLDILVNKEKVDALVSLTTNDYAQRRGREIVERLAQVIPRQQFAIPIQAAIGGQIIARADVKPFRKDVTAKLYGGDRTRKDKLLEAQKKGKARLKLVGRVEIPQSAFFAVLKRN